ncbi:MAG: hypothetical protein CM15mP25_2870 [Gammaproteobacteria bacterium]|nr:MAG: hypothetical protein CM15mP25_2870 [Gammaproteobacteria bacterium]
MTFTGVFISLLSGACGHRCPRLHFSLKKRGHIVMSLIVKTTYRVREADKASFLADFSVVAQATMAAPACDWIYVAEDTKKTRWWLCLIGSLKRALMII